MDATIIHQIFNGVPIIVVDDLDRENEGDIVIAAEKATTNNLAFMMREARGLMCIPCSGLILDRLQIPMMVETSTDKLGTPFTVSVDAAEGISTGMSVDDRLKTISVILNPESVPEQVARPGHLFPLRARDGLLKDRRGHTESSIELMRLAKCKEVAIIAEIIGDDGQMIKGDGLKRYAATHRLKIVSVNEIYKAIYG